MSTKTPKNTHPATEEDFHALLEKCLIKEYLKGKGYTQESLKSLPKDEAYELMKEASTFASGKLAEIETRAHVVQVLQDISRSLEF